ncbi:MAG: GNAT family N-acetyltransferase [Nocardioides sp.]
MLWRVRTTLADRPGALAALARHCGEREVNILGLQIFPGVAGVTDELVLSTPSGWAVPDVAALVEATGGSQVSVCPCTEQALVDGPTRYLTGVRQIVHGVDGPTAVLARLLDAEPADGLGQAAVQDFLVVGSGADRVELRRATPFTPTEHARAASFVEALAELRERGIAAPEAPVATPDPQDGHVVVRVATLADTEQLTAMHARCSAETVLRLFAAPMTRLEPRLARRLLLGGSGALVAVVGGRVVGFAALGDVADGTCTVSLLVEDGWQRKGIGTRLLGSAARLAAGRDAEDVVLRGPAESPAAVAMVFGSGLRARVKLSGDELVVTVSTRGLAPLEVVGPAAGSPALAPA